MRLFGMQCDIGKPHFSRVPGKPHSVYSYFVYRSYVAAYCREKSLIFFCAPRLDVYRFIVWRRYPTSML